MAFKLPRLKANLAIVNPKGQPLDYFLRFWNMTVAPSIEAQITDLTAITDELAAQLALILATQATANAAQADASDALEKAETQARYANMSNAAAVIKSVVVTNVPPNVALNWQGGLSGGALTDNTDWLGTVTLTEDNGVTTNVVGTASISIPSQGVQNPDLSWVAGAGSASIQGIGTLTGTVTYQVAFDNVGGSAYTLLPNMDGLLTLTPEAT